MGVAGSLPPLPPKLPTESLVEPIPLTSSSLSSSSSSSSSPIASTCNVTDTKIAETDQLIIHAVSVILTCGSINMNPTTNIIENSPMNHNIVLHAYSKLYVLVRQLPNCPGPIVYDIPSQMMTSTDPIDDSALDCVRTLLGFELNNSKTVVKSLSLFAQVTHDRLKTKSITKWMTTHIPHLPSDIIVDAIDTKENKKKTDQLSQWICIRDILILQTKSLTTTLLDILLEKVIMNLYDQWELDYDTSVRQSNTEDITLLVKPRWGEDKFEIVSFKSPSMADYIQYKPGIGQ
jgi:hypothetical protein